MSALSVREFQSLPLEENIPEASNVMANSIPVQSVITGRRSIRVDPQNGSAFTPGQNPSIKLSSMSEFLIPSSVVLHYKLQNQTYTTGAPNTASQTACFDDLPATSILNRAILRMAGNAIEDILDVNRATAALAYTHMEPANYSGEASISTRSWKWNRDYQTNSIATLPSVVAGTGTDPAVVNDVNAVATPVAQMVEGFRMDGKGVARRQALAATEYCKVGAPTANPVVEVNLPLSLIFGTFRTNKLLPLSFIGELGLEFTLADAVQAIVSSVGTDVANYAMSDVYLTADLAVVSSDYLQVLAQSFASPDPGMSYVLPIDILTVNSTQRPVTTSTASSDQNTYVYSKSTPYLKSVLFTSQNASARTTLTEYSASGMPNFFDANNCQLRLTVGSAPYPNYGVLKSPEEIMRHNIIGLGATGNVRAQFGLVTHENFKDRTTAGGIQYVLFNFAKVNGLGSEYFETDSLDISLLGSQFALETNQVGDGAATSCSVMAIIEHVQMLRLGGGRLEVMT